MKLNTQRQQQERTNRMITYHRPLVESLASTVNALSNCIASGDAAGRQRHEDTIAELCRDFLPSGSGIDSGTVLDVDASLRFAGEKLVFTLGFHHLDDGGCYDGWTQHKLTVTPSLFLGPKLQFSGPDRNRIKEYLHEVYSSALSQEIAWDIPETDEERATWTKAYRLHK
jgi:hypothetical protein